MAKQLEKSQWRAYFDRMSKVLVGKRAEIEVASLNLGDQIKAEWLPLFGISYRCGRRAPDHRSQRSDDAAAAGAVRGEGGPRLAERCGSLAFANTGKRSQ
jgi:hypothetical protein